MTTAKLPMGTIGPVSREKQIDRAGSMVATAWVKSGAPFSPETQGTGPSDFGRSGAENLGHPKAEGGPVLVMLSEEPPPALRDWLLRQGVTGSRIYLLATPYWGSDQLARELCGSRNARILVRRTPGLPCSAIHGATGGDSIWPGPTKSTGGGWCLRLDSAQSDALRQLFLRLFWHHAEDEAWTTGKAPWSFRAPMDRPFDVPPLPETSPVRLLEPYVKDLRNLAGDIQFVPTGDLPSVAPKQLIIPPSGSLHSELSGLASKGTSSSWTPLELPRAAWGNAGGFLAPATSQWVMDVRMNSVQLQALARSVPARHEWRFRQSFALAEIGRAEVWLPNEQKPRSPLVEQTLPLPDLKCPSIRECVAAEPESWSQADPLAMRVSYKWRNAPPELPKGSHVDPLIIRWQEVDKKWSSATDGLAKQLDGTKSLLNDIGSRFAAFLGAGLMGFGRSREDLANNLEELSKAVLSRLTRSEALERVERLKRVGEEIEKLSGRVSQSAEEGEEKRQRKEWDDRRDKLQAERGTLDARLSEVDAETAALKLKNEGAGEAGAADLDARTKRFADDLKKLEQVMRGVQAEIAANLKHLEEPFKFVSSPKSAPPKSSGQAKFVPTASLHSDAPIMLPDESIPNVGTLYLHQKVRYLAITRWEHLEEGENEAARLKAQLVAQEAHQ